VEVHHHARAVYTGMSGDHPEPATLGHVQVGTALGVAMHRTGGGGATQTPPLAHRVTNFFMFRSTSTRATPHKRC
jgi:hypothetical protein